MKHLASKCLGGALDIHGDEGVLDGEISIKAIDDEDLGIDSGAHGEVVGGNVGTKEGRVGEGGAEGVVSGGRGGGGRGVEEGGAIKSKAKAVAMALLRVIGISGGIEGGNEGCKSKAGVDRREGG